MHLYDCYSREFACAMNDVNLYLKEYVELSEYQMIFEADDQNVMNTMIKNKNAEEKGGNAITRAIDAVINMIKRVIGSVKDFFTRFTMNDAEKNAFYAFKQACAKDPSLANKQVTVRDWRKIQAACDGQYQQGVKMVNNALNEINNAATEEQCDAILKKFMPNINDLIKGLGRGLGEAFGKDTMTFTAGVLMKTAESNIEDAKILLNVLENDKKFMENLRANMGDKRAERYKLRVKQCASSNLLMNAKIKLTSTQYEKKEDIVNAQLKEMAGFNSNVARYVAKTGVKAAMSDQGQNAIGQALKQRGDNKRNAQYEKYLSKEPKREDFKNDDQFNRAHAKWEKGKEKYINKQQNADRKNRYGTGLLNPAGGAINAAKNAINK